MQPESIRVIGSEKGEIPKVAKEIICSELLHILRTRLANVHYTAIIFDQVVIIAINLMKTDHRSRNLLITDQHDITVTLILSIITPLVLAGDEWLPFKPADILTVVRSCWTNPGESAEKQVAEVIRMHREGCCIIL